MKPFQRCVLGVLVATLPLMGAGGQVTVAIDDPVYRLIDALPLPGLVKGVNTANRPLTEEAVVTLLSHARDSLAGVDRALVEKWLARFQTDDFTLQGGGRAAVVPVRHKGSAIIVYPTWMSRIGVQDSAFSHTGFKTYQLDSLSDRRGFTTGHDVGVTAVGSIHDLILFFNGRVTTHYSRTDIYKRANDPRKGLFQATIFSDSTGRGHFVGSDDFRTYVSHAGKFLDMKIGNDHVVWGHATGSNLLLSRIERPYFNVQLKKDLGQLHFEYIWGKLIADSAAQRRYMYAKRFTYQPRSWMTLGFSDQVITINRRIEPVYFFPFLPFYFAEHFIGDPDNRLMSFDIYCKIKQFAAVYGELFLDDLMNMTGIFANKHASDKWAGLVGVRLFNPVPRLTSVVQVEYAQVEPWVYTTSARDNQGIYNYPVHFGQILGHAYGPHARSIKVAYDAHINHAIMASLSVENLWKGDSAGSSIYDINGKDTLPDGFIRHTWVDKEYRFKRFSRNRTIFGLACHAQLRSWWQLSARAVAIREREPRIDNSLQFEISTRINY